MSLRSIALLVAAVLACGERATPGGAGSPPAPGGDAPSPAPPAPGDAPPPATPVPAPPRRLNPIPAENARQGAATWRLQRPAWRGEIEGYAARQGAAPGDDVPIAVSVRSAPTRFSWVLYRLGHYGGAGAREVARGGPLPVATQAPCATAATGLVACGWATSFTLATSAGWPSGLYAVKLVREDGRDGWIPLVLREASRGAAVLVVVPTATWQAYNAYGGESLYDDSRALTGAGRAFEVSYDRPYASEAGAGFLMRWERHLARWLEAQGEDVAYATDEDVDREPAILGAAQAVVLSAHDEYWSAGVRDAVEAVVARGASLLLFGANAGYWQIRYGPAGDGRDRRVITCYKGDARRLDPVGPASALLTVQFRQPPVSRPENALFGVMYAAWDAFGFGLTVRDPEHWAVAGAGIGPGDVLPGIGGYEVDDLFDNGATPAGVEVVGDATLLGMYGGLAHGRMVVREQGGAVVFAAGGIDFAAALAGEGRADPRVQRIAANVLARALGREPAAPQVVFDERTAARGPFASRVSLAAGVPYQPGEDDGGQGVGRLRAPVALAPLPDGSVAVLDMEAGSVRRLGADGALATWRLPRLTRPLGLAADGAGNLYVADTGNACLRALDRSGRSWVLAGACGSPGVADGPGASARFAAPAGMAVAGAALYVADVGAGAIRRVDLGGAHAVTTVPGPPLWRPTGVAAASDGTLYVVESGPGRIVALSGGGLRVVAGDTPGFADGPADAARLRPQLGIALLPDGSLLVADPGNDRVRRVKGGTVTTFAGSGRHGARSGTGDESDLFLPTGVAVAGGGRIYVSEAGASTVRLLGE